MNRADLIRSMITDVIGVALMVAILIVVASMDLGAMA